MNPEQCEFLAGDALISITPKFSEDDVLRLVCGDVGPFEAGIPVEVPLWLAINLRKRQKCTIIPPEWLNVDELKRYVVDETEQASLTVLPAAFFETAHMLVREAKEDLVDGDQLKLLVQDLWDKREAKLRTSVLKFLSQHQNSTAQMTGVLAMEWAGLRAPLLAATKQVDRLLENMHEHDQNHTDSTFLGSSRR